jgi:phosphate transport system ATP-binding protein
MGVTVDRPNRSIDTPRKLGIADESVCMEVEHLDLLYGEKQALFDVNMQIPEHCVTAFIGPSGCGKSTLLRCFNRMNDLVDGVQVNGRILLQGRTFTTRASMSPTCAAMSAWCFRSPTPFQNRSTRMSPTACGCRG